MTVDDEGTGSGHTGGPDADIGKGHGQFRRARFAWNGLTESWRTEQSFRTEVLCMVVAVGGLAWLRPAPVWWALVILACMTILAAELLNSALERLADRLHPERHEDVGAAKDMAAGGVFVLVIGATLLAALMLWDTLG